MNVHQCNLLNALPGTDRGEVSEPLVMGRGVRLERIVSAGHVSPPGFWYDQEDAEWVLLLAGRALLAIEGETEERMMIPGDAVYLPAHCRHRVAWTDPELPTVWLALFVDPVLQPTGLAPASRT